MAKVVPEAIRRRALRTLWRSNPVLANVDMLVDYGEDFTDSATVVANMQTAYQVGKGMLKHVEEMARQAVELENPEPIEDEELEDEPLALAEVTEPEPHSVDVVEDDLPPEPPTPRRMTFHIEETA